MRRCEAGYLRLSRILFLLAGTSLAAPTPPVVDEAATLKRYCVGCHNDQLKSGSLSLSSLQRDRDPQTWEKVVRRLRARQMPPAGLPRPDERTYATLLSSLESSLDRAAAAHPNPGRTDTFRRLNRTEYRNAIRDLLAVEVDVAALLPGDDASHGFDNVTVGNLSPTLLERYLTAARKISRLAVGIPSRSPGGDTFTLRPDLTQEQHFEHLPVGTRGGASFRYAFPQDADYDIVVRLARDRNEHVEGLTGTHEVELLLDGERLRVFTVSPPPAGQDHQRVDQQLHVRVPVAAGPHVVGVTFPKKPTLLLETERQPYPAHFNMDRHPRIQPAVYSISINGPYETRGPGDTPSRRLIFACRPKQSSEEVACAEKIFSALTRRAYRRPTTRDDTGIPLKFFKDSRSAADFDTAIEMGLRAILVSPEFLFRVEQDPPGAPAKTAYSISDLELASRLSFFLWSSIPDEELLRSAELGILHQPEELRRQTRRLLADRRAQALVNNFAEQWLYLRNLDSATPDMRAFPDFDDNLRQAFRRETELFFENIVREDRSVLELLSANYTFVNERLAVHYGIPNVYGSRFRRIQFDGASSAPARGGLLRQGSILTVTSYATRTSPVIRGKWVLDNILGVPPPPPPAEVPALKDKTSSGKALTMRDRLAEHRANPACSGCHQLMDPVGFALENYDAVGRWRATEESLPIDTAGGLPDGSQFDGVAGLERALRARPELFATTLTEKLLTYALGRGVEYYDAPAIRHVVRQARAEEFKFSSFILAIVGSPPFQMRRSS